MRIVDGKNNEKYHEITKNQILSHSMHIPKECLWRLSNSNCYYIEYRTIVDNVKIYLQRKKVDYADYKILYYYILDEDLILIDTKDYTESIKVFSKHYEIISKWIFKTDNVLFSIIDGPRIKKELPKIKTKTEKNKIRTTENNFLKKFKK